MRTAFLGCLLFGCLLCLRATPATAATGINQEINYQARLLNAQGATVPDGSYNIQFKIYKNGDGTLAGDTGGSGGTLLWTESWQNSNSQGITVTNGYLSAQLGTICALSGGSCQGNTNTGVDFNQSVLWLSVNIGGTSSSASPTYDGEMLPMRQLAAAPYALNSNMLGGLTATQFLQLAPNAVQTDSSTNSSIFVNKTGASGLLLELQSGGTDEATISKTGVLSLPASTGSLTINGTSVCDTTGNTGCIAKSGSGYYIHNYQTTPTLQTAAGFDIQGPSGQVTGTIEANGADILDLQNSSAVNVATFGNTGSVLLKTSTNATNAFQIQDSSANSVLTADTTNDRVGIGTNTPLNSLGVSPLQYNTGTASQTGTAITGSGTTWTSAMVGDQIVFANGVSETITAFGSTTSLTASVSQSVSSQAYKLFYPGLQVSSTGNVGIGQTSPSTLLDVAQNSAQTTAPMALLEQNGTGDATLKISNATNSNSFYLGQDASNGGSFRINSSTSSVTPTSPTAPALVQAANLGQTTGSTTIVKGFTSNVTAGNAIIVTFGWDFNTGSLSSPACTDSLNNTYTVAPVTVSDATATQSLAVCYATNSPGGSDTVTIHFTAGTQFRTIIIQEYSGVAATNPVDTFASQDVTTGTVATDGVTSGPLSTTQNGDLIYGAVEDMNSTPNATISAGTGFSSIANQANATVNVLDENKVVTTAGSGPATFTFSVAHAYAAIAVAFRAATTALNDTYSNALLTISQGGSATFQTTQNSTTGFLLQNNNGIALLTGDTVNERMTVGPAAGDTVGAILVLGNKTNSGDPTGVAGAMYYNSNTGNFRCFQGGFWINCIGSASASTSSASAASCTTTCGPIATITNGWLAGYCSGGHVFHLYASGNYSTAATGPTLAMGVYLGTSTTPASDTSLGGGSGTLTATGSITALGWEFDGYIVCNSVTSVLIHGNFSLLTSTATGATQVLKIATTSATTITNATQNVYIFPTWGTSSASNTITCNQIILQSL